ncbi:MAG: pyridoxal phosphate-dependent aminotransferase [Syntrophobacterales bacterium]|nr:pyridoxal phosphate-dependent aminotransferase [Syntrophobacterales bacterium]
MPVSQKMLQFMGRSSWIRKMFEEGARLKAIHGADKVYDFSLGNPNVYPPEIVYEELHRVVQESTPASHGYMPNAGYPWVREKIADFVSKDHNLSDKESLSPDHIVMTCGAAGGLNVVLKSILDPGDEVIVTAPYFVEYGFYIDNHGGVMRQVPTRPDFSLDIEAIENSISPKTKAVLINSPNNPTGRVYSEESLSILGNVLDRKSLQFGKVIYLISDEPYRRIVFDDLKVPSILKMYPHSFVVTSYSKDLCLPGERIGFIAVNPLMENVRDVIDSLILANRILGFVNAPALMQRLVARLQGVSVDPLVYQKKRDKLYNALIEIGYECVKPEGAFYLFPRTPISDDVTFVKMLQEELVLVVPGTGFGCPSHMRIAYCVDDSTIEGSIDGFARAFKRAKAI